MKQVVDEIFYRKVGYAQGQNVNLIMVQQGMAWAYRQYLHDVAYLQAEQTARENRRGLWRDHSPVEPHLWRQQRR